jgi:hypothetical protein
VPDLERMSTLDLAGALPVVAPSLTRCGRRGMAGANLLICEIEPEESGRFLAHLRCQQKRSQRLMNVVANPGAQAGEQRCDIVF